MQIMKFKTIKISIVFIILFLFISTISLYIFSQNHHDFYKIDKDNFMIEIDTETYSYNSKTNIYKRYYLNDTIVINNTLDHQEIEKIKSIVSDSRIFNYDSIYINNKNGVVVTLPDLKTEIFITDKSNSRKFIIYSSFSHNLLSSKNDYYLTLDFIAELTNIFHNNKKIILLPSTDLEFM